jgi:hypothetical protein
MSIDERLTKQIAISISRRSFLKSLGGFAAVLGLAMVGESDQIASDCSTCCPGPHCGNCRNAESTCPIGYIKISHCYCCIGNCHYTCTHCERSSWPWDDCWCGPHDDLSSCGGGPCATLSPP